MTSSDRKSVDFRTPTYNERFQNESEHELFPDETHQHKNCRVCGPGPLNNLQVPSAFDHVYFGNVVYADDYGFQGYTRGRVTSPERADVVTSELEHRKKGKVVHTLMIDIDFPARLVPSARENHWHLYVDHVMPWRKYKRLLRAMYKSGLIEYGFYRSACRNRATHLRVPWKPKDKS